MQYRKEGKWIFLKLEQDEVVFEKLKELCGKEGIESAIVVNGIGMMKEFKLGYFDGKEYVRKEFEKAFELVGMQGNIVKDEEGEWIFHLHVSVADEQGDVFGGHFFNGKAHIANEIVIRVIGINAVRKLDKSGLKGLQFGDGESKR